jgi:iron complex transport system ATP-binding protein
MSAVIEVEDLNFAYSRQNPVLRGLSFAVNKGLFVAIAGPNGAGKTTLVKLLCGLLRPDGGETKIDSAPIESYSARALARKVAVVHQEQQPVFDFSVAQVVAMARTAYLGTLGFETEADRQIIQETLEMTDTARFAGRAIRELSGGERQRVFIARAIAQDTPVLLLDEPTSFLDMKHQVGIYDLLKKMQVSKGRTIVSVTHDINLAGQYCDEVLLLGSDGGYDYGAVGEVFCKERIERVFGVRTFTATIGEREFFLPVGEFGYGGR